MNGAHRIRLLTRSHALAGAAILALVGGCSRSADAPATPAEAHARGEEITGRMLQVYRQAKSYSDHATYIEQSAYRGEGIERELPYFEMSLAFERPNRLRLTLQESLPSASGQKGYEIVSNGARMRASAAALAGQIQESAAPPEITTQNLFPDPLLRELFAHRSLGDVFPQLAMLLNEDDATLVFPRDENPRLLDTKTLRDRECFRVATSHPEGTRILWIDCEDYRLHRMELPTDAPRRSLDANNQLSHLAMWIDFKDATLDAEISAEAFEKEVPADAVRVRRFVAPAPPAPPAELGKPVADFAFETLDGKPVTRASLAGKTALLDLWQIDCPPCKAHTPDLEKVYQELKSNDDFAFYAVNTEGPAAPDAAVEKTIRRWGGTMPVLRDRTGDSLTRIKLRITPTLMLVGADGRLQYLHLGAHRAPDALVALIRKLQDGVDLAAQVRAEHAQLVADYEKELKAETISDSILEVEVARPEVGERELPASFAATELWRAGKDAIERPGNLLTIEQEGQRVRILALDGGQAIVELDAAGAKVARHELPDNPEQAGGFLRTAVDPAGRRWVAASGVGWQKVHVFDDQWKHVMAFPDDRHPGIADAQLANLAAGHLRLFVGYWGGVGVQGVGLDGKRKWAERSLDQVVELATVSNDAADDAPHLWCTSNRGTILVLNAKGERQRQITVGDHNLMHVAVADLDGDGSECCGLAVENVGQYRAVGFNPDGEVLWTYDLPPGEYSHQVERIQAAALPGGQRAWMIASADGSIHWLDAAGKLVDKFVYGETLTGLSLTNTDGIAILLVSTPADLTVWKLHPNKVD